MDAKLFILMIVIASIATFSLSLADSVELLASKTEAYKGENVLLVAIAKFSSTTAVRVDKIEIFENGVKIKECRNSGSEQYFCFVFVKSDVSPVTKEYFARVTYTTNYDPTIESNRVRVSWVNPPENVQVPAINVTSILDLLNQITNNNINILSAINSNLSNLLNVIQTMNLNQINKIYDELTSLLFIYSSMYTKPYFYSYSPAIYSLAATSSEDLCLDFEKIENRVVEDRKVNVFVRNCGNFALYNVTVMFVVGENVQIKVIPFILPNEVKFVYFNVDVKEGERKLASVFAFNDLVNIKTDFYIEKISPILTLKLEIPQVNLVKGKWNEFFITLKNLDAKTLQDLQVIVEGEKNIVVNVEVSKVSLLPLQTKNLKVSVFVTEEFDKNKALFRFNVGGIERIVEMNVIEEKKKESFTVDLRSFEVSLIVIVALVILLILAALTFLTRKKIIQMQRTIEI